LQKQLVEKFPNKPDYLHSLAVSYNNLSFLQAKTDPRKAEESLNNAFSIQQKLVDQFPASAEYQSDLALSLNNLGALENHNDRLEQAEAAYRKAIAIQEQLARKSPSVSHFRSDLAISHNNLGRVFSKYEHFDQAKTAFESAKSIMKEMLGDYPEDLGYRSSLAGILNNLGMVSEQQHQLEDAAQCYAQAIENQRFAFEHAGQLVQFRDFLCKHYANYCRVLRSLDRHEDNLGASRSYRDICKDDPEQLFRIAVELAETAEKMKEAKAATAAVEEADAEDDSVRDKYLDLAVETLEKSIDAGLQPPARIKTDAGLKSLRNGKKYETLLDRLTKTEK
jgi:tetratricopeptide (TPR) repeat protein